MISDRDMPSMSPPRHELAALADELMDDIRHHGTIPAGMAVRCGAAPMTEPDASPFARALATFGDEDVRLLWEIYCRTSGIDIGAATTQENFRWLLGQL